MEVSGLVLWSFLAGDGWPCCPTLFEQRPWSCCCQASVSVLTNGRVQPSGLACREDHIACICKVFLLFQLIYSDLLCKKPLHFGICHFTVHTAYYTVSDYLCIAIAVSTAHFNSYQHFLLVFSLPWPVGNCDHVVLCARLWSLKWWFQTFWAWSYTCTQISKHHLTFWSGQYPDI